MSGDLSGFSMMDLFRMEAESHTTTLAAGLVSLEGGPASPAVIEPLMRAAHSMKGAARIVGLDAAVRVAHAMEDCFVAAQKGKLVLDAGHVDILLRGVDLLVQIAQVDEPEIEPWQSEHAMAIDTLVGSIVAIQEGKALPCAQTLPLWLNWSVQNRSLVPDRRARQSFSVHCRTCQWCPAKHAGRKPSHLVGSWSSSPRTRFASACGGASELNRRARSSGASDG